MVRSVLWFLLVKASIWLLFQKQGTVQGLDGAFDSCLLTSPLTQFCKGQRLHDGKGRGSHWSRPMRNESKASSFPFLLFFSSSLRAYPQFPPASCIGHKPRAGHCPRMTEWPSEQGWLKPQRRAQLSQGDRPPHSRADSQTGFGQCTWSRPGWPGLTQS